ncbi:DUF2867 domain-containing protein [Nakamurella sp. A5-74]|uniref:DUF2867 domain-containing protein n=1 Tax=Nakamurella sp. A5-74 TaxID=3158264 RepID=A0AAU8DN44_9ACTN
MSIVTEPLTAEPAFVSYALDGPRPADWATVTLVAVPTDPSIGAEAWAAAVFSPRSAPLFVKVLFGLRQVLVRLIGIPPATDDVFAVDTVVDGEAVIVTEDAHLDFRAGIAFDADRLLLRVTTAVWFKGLRGRIYFVPVAFAHDVITRAMMRRAIRGVIARQGLPASR